MYRTIFTVIEEYDRDVKFVNDKINSVAHTCEHKKRKLESQWFLNETLEPRLLKPTYIYLDKNLIFQNKAVRGGICEDCNQIFIVNKK